MLAEHRLSLLRRRTNWDVILRKIDTAEEGLQTQLHPEEEEEEQIGEGHGRSVSPMGLKDNHNEGEGQEEEEGEEGIQTEDVKKDRKRKEEVRKKRGVVRVKFDAKHSQFFHNVICELQEGRGGWEVEVAA